MNNQKAIEVLKTYLHEDDKEGELAFDLAIQALEKERSEIKWFDVKEKSPRSGEEVLTYYWDELDEGYGIHQIDNLTYFEKGDKFTFEDLAEDEKPFNIVRWLNDEYDREVEESGFYIYDTDKNGLTRFRLHNDDITHWMSLPLPPNDKKGLLAGLDME